MKTCNLCQQTKEYSNFIKSPSCADGHRSYCNSCRAEKNRIRYHAKKAAGLPPKSPNSSAQTKAWRQRNKEHIRNYENTRYREDPEYKKARDALNSARHRRTHKTLPPWADFQAIKEFYKNRPDGHHVDHIIPLRGKLVSGLHVLENLQYLPITENLIKGNRICLT